ncbi:phosphohistidine phosphatase SixA [bacterium]|nr:phosphohistidine phosphatase SixA [bacterium]
MRLFLLRHGLAGQFGDPAWPDDRLRPLTNRGVDRLNRHMAALATLGLAVDQILTSDFVRARQTAEIAAKWLGTPGLVETESLHPWEHPREVEAELQKGAGTAKTVMLVGHEPQMSTLVSWFLAGDDSIDVRFKKGAVVRIDFDGLPSAGEGQLIYMLPPRVMDQLLRDEISIEE